MLGSSNQACDHGGATGTATAADAADTGDTATTTPTTTQILPQILLPPLILTQVD